MLHASEMLMNDCEKDWNAQYLNEENKMKNIIFYTPIYYSALTSRPFLTPQLSHGFIAPLFELNFITP